MWKSLRAMDGGRLAAIPNVTGRRLRFGTGGEFPSLGHFLVTQARPGGSATPSQGLQRPFWLSDPETRDNSDEDGLKADREGSPSPGTPCAPLPAAHGRRNQDSAPLGCREHGKDTARTGILSSGLAGSRRELVDHDNNQHHFCPLSVRIPVLQRGFSGKVGGELLDPSGDGRHVRWFPAGNGCFHQRCSGKS